MKILSILFILLVIPVVAQTDAKTQQNKIQGTWQTNSLGDQMTLILNTDGSGEFDGEAIKYTTKDNKFTMTIVAENETHVYTYNLQGNSLTISGGDLETPITFDRKAEKSPKK